MRYGTQDSQDWQWLWSVAPEALEEGALLQVEKVAGIYQMTPADAEFTRQVEAFLRTEPLHRNSYRELAK